MKKLKKSLFGVFILLLSSVLCLLVACDLFGGEKEHTHRFFHYVSNNDATCTTNATETAKCDLCDETDTREKINSELGHSFISYVTVSEATCTQNATERAKCERCDETDTREVSNSRLGHSFISYVTASEATCTANATQTAKCERCDETDTREIANSKLGHSFISYVTASEATCTANATQTAKCERCDETDTHEIANSKLGHSFLNYVTVEATCTQNASEKAKCERCDGTDTREIANSKLGHSFINYVSASEATCVSNATETAKCERCDETDTREIPDSKGEHSFTNYVSNGDATTEADGTKTAKCDYCDETHTIVDEGSKLPASPPGGIPVAGSKSEIADAEFSIHFLELGNKYTGDCTLIKCGDVEVLIDAGSRKNSAAAIKKYVDQYCTDGILEYVIVTHAHQDHIAGFVGNSATPKRTGILYQYEIGTLIQFAGHNTTTEIYNEYCEAVKYAQNNGTTVYTAKQCWYGTDGAKKQYFLDGDKTLSMNILYNYYYDNSTDDENDYSVCMMLTKTVGGKSYNYLFTGDLEAKGESYLVERNNLPEVELFKGGHHGSYTATTDKLLSVIKPKCIAVCCCCGTTEYTKNKDNTFPAQAFIDRVAKYTEYVYCTTLCEDYAAGKYSSMNGDITFYYKDEWKLYCTANNTKLKDTEWFKANRVWRP